MNEETQKELIRQLEAFCECAFVPANTTKEMPPYPYVSFNIIRTTTAKGTYHDNNKGISRQPEDVTYSFTAQSKGIWESYNIARKIRTYCEEYGTEFLRDAGIVVKQTGEITQRDNLLTLEYEYRNGLDVTLAMWNTVEEPDFGTIEKIIYKER